MESRLKPIPREHQGALKDWSRRVFDHLIAIEIGIQPQMLSAAKCGHPVSAKTAEKIESALQKKGRIKAQVGGDRAER